MPYAVNSKRELAEKLRRADQGLHQKNIDPVVWEECYRPLVDAGHIRFCRGVIFLIGDPKPTLDDILEHL